jgi:membrane-bound lytic murein transglycosylase A
MNLSKLLFSFFLAFFLFGCASRPEVPTTRLDAVSWSSLPGWHTDDIAAGWDAWLLSCRVLSVSRKSQGTWGDVCAAALLVDGADPAAVRDYFETLFTPHRVFVDDKDGTRGDALVTGYYEPLLRGSRTRDDAFRFPVYAKPADLLSIELGSVYPDLAGKRLRGRVEGDKVVPYHSREALSKTEVNADVLVWLDNEMDVFFLQIQGSGRAVLPDGDTVRIGYADQNGHPYKAVAGTLIAWGEMTKDSASMQAIRAWGDANPDRLPKLLNSNPSYVFFRELPIPTDPLDIRVNGPIGALGVPLLGGRAIAIDRNQLPLGAPVFLDATLPDGNPLQRLTFAQDTGGAIRGALRADFYFGTGDKAGEQAGMMKQQGKMWVLLPKTRASAK